MEQEAESRWRSATPWL